MTKKVLVAAILFVAVGCTRVSPGHVGIVVNQWGSEKGVAQYVAQTGQITYNPITTTIYTYPTFVQNYVWTKNPSEGSTSNEEITFTIKGNMAISLDVSIAYRLDPTKVPAFYVQFRSDDLRTFTNGFLHNVTRDSFNEEGGRFELDQIMGDNAEFVRSVRKLLESRVNQYGVIIEQFGIIGAPRPPDGVQQAINAKIQATQLAIQKQNELVQATADAAKTVATAEGTAKSTLLLAQTQAKANELLNASLTEKLVQYRAIDKWDGKLPQVQSGSNSGLLIQLPNQK